MTTAPHSHSAVTKGEAFAEEIRARIAPFANPLAGAAPAGSDLSYDAEFERIAAEIEKLSSLAGGTVDWMLVADDSARMLTERSKDLRLAGWLTVAKAQREGWRGVAEGLFATQALVDTFWDTMYPPVKRAKARAGLLTWLWESLEKMLSGRAVTAADVDVVKALETLVSDLDTRLGERLGNLNPGVGRFRSVVRDKVRALPAPPPPPAAAPPPKTEEVPSTNGTTNGGGIAASAQAPQAAASPVAVAVAVPMPVAMPVPVPVSVAAAAVPVPVPAAPPVPVGGSLDELQEAASKWQEGLVALARAARATAPAHPWAYRLIRVATWLTLDGVPEHKSGLTRVRPPRGLDHTGLKDLHAGSHWADLLEAAEVAVVEYMYWLDPHYFSAIALDRLNRHDARDAVSREVVAFAARMPGVEQLKFTGGMPFASPETLEWLERERARWGGGASAATGVAAGAAAGGAGPAIAPEVLEAVAGARDGSDLAMAKLLRAAERGDARSRFVGRLETAKIALDKNRNDLALELAELLLPEVTDTLEAWEPTLAADALAHCLRAIRTNASNREQDAADERESRLFRRLLRLDPEAALRVRSS